MTPTPQVDLIFIPRLDSVRFSKFETKMAAGKRTHLNPTNLRNNKDCEQPNAHLLMAHHALPGSCAWQAKRIPCGRLGIRLINLGPDFAVGKRAKNKNRKNIGQWREPSGGGLGRGKGRRHPFPCPEYLAARDYFFPFLPKAEPGPRLSTDGRTNQLTLQQHSVVFPVLGHNG